MNCAASAQQVHNIGLMIGLPVAARPDPAAVSPRPVTVEWALALACHSYLPNVNVRFYPVKSKDVAAARNVIVQAALDSGSKYLWFVDDDVEIPFFAARKLIYDLEQHPEVAVVGGIYSTKEIPAEPLVFNGNGIGSYWNWKEGDFFPVSGIATGCMMIRVDIFKQFDAPWFKWGDMPTEFEGKPTTEFLTDDLYFCRKVTDAGMKIMADGGIICIHWDIEKGIPYRIADDSYPMRKNGDGH